MLRRHGTNGIRSLPSRTASFLTALHRSRSLAQHDGASPIRTAAPLVVLQTRGKKTKTTVKLSELPQGAIQVDSPLPEPEQNVPAYPTVVLQARRNMDKFDNCVLLTRVGGFYELYFDHADEFGPLLNLKVATKKTNAGPVPMVWLHPRSTLYPLT